MLFDPEFPKSLYFLIRRYNKFPEGIFYCGNPPSIAVVGTKEEAEELKKDLGESFVSYEISFDALRDLSKELVGGLDYLALLRLVDGQWEIVNTHYLGTKKNVLI